MPGCQNFEMMPGGLSFSEICDVIYRRNRESLNFPNLMFFLHRCLLVHDTGSFLISGASSVGKGFLDLYIQKSVGWHVSSFVGSCVCDLVLLALFCLLVVCL